MIDWWQEGILRCSPRPDNAHFSKRKHHLCSSGDEAIEAARPAHQLALPRRPDNFCVSVLFFSTVMIASFLQESSIHGLRYLVEAKSSLVKTIWFVCIAACVTASFVIIYYNVVNWHNSPAVVTSVYPSLVKGLIPMPMVTICPHYIDTNGLLYRLLDAHPDLVTDEEMVQLNKAIGQQLIEQRFVKWRVTSYSQILRAKETFAECNDEANHETEKCKFVLLLNAIAIGVQDEDRDFQCLRDFLIEKAAAGLAPTLEGLQEFVEQRFGYPLDQLKSMPSYKTEWWEMESAYTYFFPLFSDDGNDLEPLRSLDEYNVGQQFEVTKELLGSTLAYMNDRLILKKFAENDLMLAAINIFLNALKRYLGAEDVFEAWKLLNVYVTDPVNNGFLPYYKTDVVTGGYPCPKDKPSFEEACSPEAERTAACQDYCNLVKNGTLIDAVTKVRDLYVMANYSIGPLRRGNPVSLLPVCKHPGSQKLEQDCWNRIINDRGICFSSAGKDIGPLISGTGKDFLSSFVIDVGGEFYVKEVLPFREVPYPTFDIIITPPGQFAFGKLEEEERILMTYGAYDALRYTWNIKVVANYVAVTTPEFRGLSKDTRHCLYQDEKDLQFFPLYSQPNCLLECSWKEAIKDCNCVPWYLLEYFPQQPTCEIYGNLCFTNRVSERFNLANSCTTACLEDCEIVEYSVVLEREPFDIPWDDNFSGEIFAAYMTTDKVANADPVVLEVTDLLDKKPKVDSIGVIKVYMDKKSTLRILVTATVTVIDMISNIGGTLGLFCGFSILSGVEILYWVGKVLAKKRTY